jgi:transposase
MLSLGSTTRYFLCREAVDFRKSFDGLSGVVRGSLRRDPTSGDAYIFVNRRRDSVKILLWDRTGFVLWHKRLERGTFELPTELSSPGEPLPWQSLVLILEGICLRSARFRKRFSLKN